MQRARTLALVVSGIAVVAVAVLFGIDWAAFVVLVLVVTGGFAYSAATIGDWIQAWGRRSGESSRRRR
jgi:hypothetical protein